MAQPATFWNRIAKRYAKQAIPDEAAYRKKLEVSRRYFRPDMELLEFGCGSGSTAIAHAPYVKHITAIDISDKMLEIAQAKAEAGDVGNITFQHTTIEEVGLPDESLDAVLGLSILHLLDNREAVISKIYRLLKPGGVFISNTMCMGNSQKLFKFFLPVGKYLGILPSVQFFTSGQLQKNIADAGFRIDYQWQPVPDKAVFIVAIKS